MRPSLDRWALDLATDTARRSTCLRRSVGCVLLDARGRVLSTGYNGVASGLPHCNDVAPDADVTFGPLYPHACPGVALASGTGLDLCGAVHAEQNAVASCRDDLAVMTCCVTTSPCTSCVKLLLNTGCRRIVFADEYPDPNAARLWASVGREWLRLT